jgi:hypothetical protein
LGLDGVEIGLIIVGFACLFGGHPDRLSGGLRHRRRGVISFAHHRAARQRGAADPQAIDTGSRPMRALLAEGGKRHDLTFRYPDLPTVMGPGLPAGLGGGADRNISFIVNRINERVLAGPSIETLLAVLMFVLMGITLERSKIANDLLTTMARVFGPLPGGLAVSIVVVGAFLAASTGIVGATVVTMGLLALPTMLRNNYSPGACHRGHRGFRHAGPDHSAVHRDRASGHARGRHLFHRAGGAGADRRAARTR